MTDKAKEFDMDRDNIAKVMATQEGRDMLWRFLNAFGFFAGTFDVDAIKLAYNTGGRNAGVWLWDEMNDAAPEQVIKMLQENKE